MHPARGRLVVHAVVVIWALSSLAGAATQSGGSGLQITGTIVDGAGEAVEGEFCFAYGKEGMMVGLDGNVLNPHATTAKDGKLSLTLPADFALTDDGKVGVACWFEPAPPKGGTRVQTIDENKTYDARGKASLDIGRLEITRTKK